MLLNEGGKASPTRSIESARTAGTSPSSIDLDPNDCPGDGGRGGSRPGPRRARQLRCSGFRAAHFAPFAHGRWETAVPVACACLALVLSLIARRTTSFVTLADPLLLSPSFERLDRLGLVYVDLCLATELTTTDMDSKITTVVERDRRRPPGGRMLRGGSDDHYLYGPRRSSDDYFPYSVRTADDDFFQDGGGWDEDPGESSPPEAKVCRTIKVTSGTLNDGMWHLSRTFLSLSIALGSVLSFVLCSAVYWATINLRPVAAGLLLVYFSESMTFFFFDSAACRRHGCSMDAGAVASIVASILWFAAAVGTVWMDMVRRASELRRQRQRMRRARRARRRKELKRRSALERGVLNTESSTGHLSSLPSSGAEGGIAHAAPADSPPTMEESAFLVEGENEEGFQDEHACIGQIGLRVPSWEMEDDPYDLRSDSW